MKSHTVLLVVCALASVFPGPANGDFLGNLLDPTKWGSALGAVADDIWRYICSKMNKHVVQVEVGGTVVELGLDPISCQPRLVVRGQDDADVDLTGTGAILRLAGKFAKAAFDKLPNNGWKKKITKNKIAKIMMVLLQPDDDDYYDEL